MRIIRYNALIHESADVVYALNGKSKWQRSFEFYRAIIFSNIDKSHVVFALKIFPARNKTFVDFDNAQFLPLSVIAVSSQNYFPDR